MTHAGVGASCRNEGAEQQLVGKGTPLGVKRPDLTVDSVGSLDLGHDIAVEDGAGHYAQATRAWCIVPKPVCKKSEARIGAARV